MVKQPRVLTCALTKDPGESLQAPQVYKQDHSHFPAAVPLVPGPQLPTY